MSEHDHDEWTDAPRQGEESNAPEGDHLLDAPHHAADVVSGIVEGQPLAEVADEDAPVVTRRPAFDDFPETKPHGIPLGEFTSATQTPAAEVAVPAEAPAVQVHAGDETAPAGIPLGEVSATPSALAPPVGDQGEDSSSADEHVEDWAEAHHFEDRPTFQATSVDDVDEVSAPEEGDTLAEEPVLTSDPPLASESESAPTFADSPETVAPTEAAAHEVSLTEEVSVAEESEDGETAETNGASWAGGPSQTAETEDAAEVTEHSPALEDHVEVTSDEQTRVEDGAALVETEGQEKEAAEAAPAAPLPQDSAETDGVAPAFRAEDDDPATSGPAFIAPDSQDAPTLGAVADPPLVEERPQEAGVEGGDALPAPDSEEATADLPVPAADAQVPATPRLATADAPSSAADALEATPVAPEVTVDEPETAPAGQVDAAPAGDSAAAPTQAPASEPSEAPIAAAHEAPAHPEPRPTAAERPAPAVSEQAPQETPEEAAAGTGTDKPVREAVSEETAAAPSHTTDEFSARMWASVRDREPVLTGEEVSLVDDDPSRTANIVGGPKAQVDETSAFAAPAPAARPTRIPPMTRAERQSQAAALAAAEALAASTAPSTSKDTDRGDAPADTEAAASSGSTTALAGAVAGIAAASAAAAAPKPTTSDEEIARRREFITAAPAEEQDTPAPWRRRSSPRGDAADAPAQKTPTRHTPTRLDDSLLEESTVVPEIASRTGAHVASLLLLLFLPLAWYLGADAGARMALNPQGPAATGFLNGLALVELTATVVLCLFCLILTARSSLGAWVTGALVTVVGLPWVALPNLVKTAGEGVFSSLADGHALAANFAHHLQLSGYSGRLLLLGLALLGAAMLSHDVRRKGRREESLRAEVARVDPSKAFFTAGERRRAGEQSTHTK
ncbi:hypothetical protein I6B53_00805 [Schaalia sp. 19OD2882]|uniref:hypothetical protein n=1 Tax=Schaalia sp. 19OD2882 TaxID=2794089 RepID=UPI001C1EC7D2|nr:hypothetical protein [Schaalia sp. 19OD2882]QWW19715.1 hypothetical protein I6B53_00805 [Schaalia sp. 19OD2882]